MHLRTRPAPRRKSRSDNGFTLIELLLSISILGVIAAPVGAALIVILKNMDSGSARLTASSSAQISAAYFAQDVDTMGVHDYSTSRAPQVASVLLAGSSGVTCGTSGTSALVRFLSDSYDTTASPAQLRSAVVSWAVVATTGDNQLVRTRCVNGTVVSQTAVAHYLSSTPTVACSTTCNSSTVPASVTLTFTVAPKGASAYTVTLAGTKRQT